MVLKRFCPKCGKVGITSKFCSDCDPKNDLLEGIDISAMKLCLECRKFQQRNGWVAYKSLKDAVILYVKSKFAKRGLIGVDMNIPDHKPGPGLNVEFEITLTISTEEFQLPFMISYTTCEKCSKKNTEYFEGILQMRNPNRTALKFFDRQVKENEGRGVFVNKTAKVRGGLDFYLTKNSFTKKVASQLRDEFGGVVKISSRHFSRNTQTSKDLHRVTAMIKLPDFVKGDFIVVDGSLYRVERLAKRLVLHDMILDKRKTFDYKDLEITKIKPQKTQLSKIYPAPEVIHPNTFQSVPVRNRIPKMKANKKVNVIVFNDDVFVV